MTPLVLFTLKLKRVTLNETIKYQPIEQICRVNSIIYTKDDLLAKHIRTKFLTNLIEMGGYNWLLRSGYLGTNLRGGIMYEDHLDYKFKVIIDNMKDFIDRPIIPSVDNTSDAINQFLIDNQEAMFDAVCL